MKNLLFIGILYFIPSNLNAQYFMSYDNNGNIVARKVNEMVQDNLHGNDSYKTDNDLVVDVKQDNDRLIVDVDGSHNEEINVNLYDSSSKLVNKESSSNTRHILDCSSIPDGVYVLEVKCADNIHSQKILKK